ncbi:MAG TPA: RluA family pseudouridine synthase [Syntrophomonadaceae bacterium]|nr:RluA family pseudouridine synthase [Syntrophomonadaceae bacterium]HPR93687.1 RluA family pseudouridine synthase [Syntrophomonadaceae bacterium]
MTKQELLIVNEEMEGERLDAFVAEHLEYLSRSMVKTLLDDGQITINGQKHKASYRIKEGEEITVNIPEPKAVEIVAQDIPLQIVYQDSDLVIIDKPQGMVVHPAQGNWDNTLVNALLFHVKDLSGINGELRPGIVHRLDKDTSGLLAVAKNDIAHRHLAVQIKDHTFNRQYIALVHGIISEKLGRIEAPIGRSKIDRKKMAIDKDGKMAISEYQVLDRFKNYSLVKVKLLTGRTHQIRVHFAYINHPVVGDPLYGPARKHFDINGQALHAGVLGFVHPSTGEYMEFHSDIPPYMQNIINNLEK